MGLSRLPGWPAEQPTLAAAPFLLRPWRPSDIDDVYVACQDESIPRWTTVPSPYRRDDAVEYIEHVAPAGFAEGRSASFAIVSGADGRLMGSCSLRVLSETTGEIGYWVAADARGRGVARAAAAALIDFGMGSLGMRRIEIVIDPENAASRAVAEACGAVDEGVVEGRCQSRTGPLDAVVYAVERR